MIGTSYTYPVLDGEITDFETFALRCAEVILPRGTPTLDPYYEEQMQEASQELSRLEGLTLKEKKLEHQQAEDTQLKEYEDQFQKAHAARKRLVAMRREAALWDPPTEEHHYLKAFMLEQIDKTEVWYPHPPKPFPDLDTWWAGKVEEQRRLIAEFNGSLKKAQDRVEQNTNWFKTLKGSLK